MNELINAGDKRMTVREVAEALGYKPDTIQGKVKELFPSLVKNGVATTLSMIEVDAIKRSLVPRNLGLKSEVENAVTPLDIERMTLQVIQYHTAKIAELQAELAAAAPKIEAHAALMRSDRNMSITDAAKHFGLHPKTQVFPYLRDRGYLTAHDLPTQAAIDAGYLQLRETHCPDGSVRAQAVVPVASLDIWRLRVVPQIAAWIAQ